MRSSQVLPVSPNHPQFFPNSIQTPTFAWNVTAAKKLLMIKYTLTVTATLTSACALSTPPPLPPPTLSIYNLATHYNFVPTQNFNPTDHSCICVISLEICLESLTIMWCRPQHEHLVPWSLMFIDSWPWTDGLNCPSVRYMSNLLCNLSLACGNLLC